MKSPPSPQRLVSRTALRGGREAFRLVRWAVAAAVLQGCVLAAMARVLPGFTVDGPGSVVFAAVVLTAIPLITWPVVYWLAASFHPALFPVLSYTIAGAQIVLLTDVAAAAGFRGMHVDNLGAGVLISLFLTTGSTLLGALFSLRDDAAYDWFVTRPLRRRYAGAPRSDAPGVLFLEIDGLAEPILRKAISGGWMPTLRRWLEGGSHRLTIWEPDLSSQTSASQAGILLGDNTGIPAFRWYDKPAGRLMVSSSAEAARELERRLSTGKGLLRHGASRWNAFSGDAPDALCTYSTLGARGRARSGSYLAYFANPYTLSRAVGLFISDIVRERWQAWQQARRNERPRIRRTMAYAAVRAATTTVMQEAALFMLLSDMCRGVPASYCTFFAYDEVAHHSGIDRTDAFKVLATLDRAFGVLERAAAMAPRPYRLVVLSDHGQSMGATFRQRYGQTLGQVVSSLIDPRAHVTADERLMEDWGHINLAVNEALRQGADARTARLLRRALRRWTVGDSVVVGPARAGDAVVAGASGQSDVVVLASGNLGVISFPQWTERLTYEQIVDRFPTLLPGLVAHDGIGFVLVHSATEGGLAIGRAGIHYLDHGYADGEDPLVPYGPNAARHLRRTDGFVNAPDLLVMSRFDPAVEEVTAFEELVGSHGGLGGPQTRPFVLHPIEFDPGTAPIVGAGALHRVLASWLPAFLHDSPPAPG